ncbi:MAG: DUF4231 domain-containing protein [Oculatellaceae cyanobacterium bins.114]|nr:DUF4231 domain-containing protein [Oculatellaceae cyanobacterium bins.114]
MTSDTPTTAPRNPILEDAWDRYSRYDFNATKAQKRFIQQRKLILVLGVAATTLAIIYTVLENRSENGIPWLSDFVNRFLQDQFLPALHVFVVLVPILSTALIAYSLRFNMGANWIALRSSAEALKKEIYLYRMRVGEYSPTALGTETRDVHLAKKAKIINKRLMETQVNQTGLEAYKGKLPPQYSTAEGDDGFSDMTAEQYLLWRIEDQFTYYQRKSVKFTTELQRFQLVIILLGGLGTALAAFNLEIWVAISGALATAFATFLEFKGVETTIVACNTAAADLYDVRTWWRALSDDSKASSANIETLVQSAEAIVQSENAGWVQEMRDALAEIYSGDKEEVSKKEAFAPVLGKDFVAEQSISGDATSYVASDSAASDSAASDNLASDATSDYVPADHAASEYGASDATSESGAAITDYSSSPEETSIDAPIEATPSEFSSEETTPQAEMPQEQLVSDIVVPPADHADPFSEPPAEPVVHEELFVDGSGVESSPELISLDPTADPLADPVIDTPAESLSDSSLDVPTDVSIDPSVDASDESQWDVLVDIPVEPDGAMDIPVDAPVLDEAVITDPSATWVAEQASTESASEASGAETPSETAETTESSTTEDPHQDEPSMTTVI